MASDEKPEPKWRRFERAIHQIHTQFAPTNATVTFDDSIMGEDYRHREKTFARICDSHHLGHSPGFLASAKERGDRQEGQRSECSQERHPKSAGTESRNRATECACHSEPGEESTARIRR
jgi:hypothetical protein